MELASLGLNEGETEGGRGSRSAESQNIRALCISHGSLPFEAFGTCDAPPEVHRRSVVLVEGDGTTSKTTVDAELFSRSKAHPLLRLQRQLQTSGYHRRRKRRSFSVL